MLLMFSFISSDSDWREGDVSGARAIETDGILRGRGCLISTADGERSPPLLLRLRLRLRMVRECSSESLFSPPLPGLAADRVGE